MALSPGMRVSGGAIGDIETLKEPVRAFGSPSGQGFWLDAAYVAERVLTPEELVAYVDRYWPQETPPKGNIFLLWGEKTPGGRYLE